MTDVKVWGGLLMLAAHQVRVIVRAKSQRAACDLLAGAGFGHITVGHLRNYFSLTGNADELSVAVEDGVWYAPATWCGPSEYTRLARRPGKVRA